MSTSHGDSEPPFKRRRNDLESTQEEIVKHGTLYFEDGSIVLLSLPTENTVTAFKLYKEVLRLNSQVFEGMLSIPSPPNVELYDGVPLVRLQDTADELIHFLMAIHDPTAIPIKKDFYVSEDKVNSVFKLSKKYEADKLFRVVTDVIVEIWPDNISQWDSIGDVLYMWPGKDRYKVSLPEPCNTIRLAREYGVPNVLPVAFFQLYNNVPTAFQQSSSVARRGELWCSTSSFETNFKNLSREDFMTFVRGSCAINAFVQDLYWRVLEFFEERLEACATHDACNKFLVAFAKRHVDAASSDGHPLDLLRERGIRKLDPSGFCERCLLDYIGFMALKRAHFWGKLPRFFGLQKARV